MSSQKNLITYANQTGATAPAGRASPRADDWPDEGQSPSLNRPASPPSNRASCRPGPGRLPGTGRSRGGGGLQSPTSRG